MPTVVNFEVYAQTEQGWVLQGRFPGDDKAGAIEEAKNIEYYAKIPVRVAREVYYSESNYSEERIVYTGRIKPRPEMPGQDTTMKGKGRQGAHGGAIGAYEARSHDAPFSENDIFATYGNPGGKRPLGAGDFAFRLVIVLIASLVVAISGTGVCSLILSQLAKTGIRFSPSTQSMMLFGVFFGLFLITAAPMVSMYVPLQSLRRKMAGADHEVEPAGLDDYSPDDFQIGKGMAPVAEPEAPPAKTDPLDAMLPPDETWPQPVPPEEHDPAAQRARQAAEDAREKQRRKDEVERRKAEQKAAQEAARKAAEQAALEQDDADLLPDYQLPDDFIPEEAAPLSAAYEQARLTVMKFLGEVISSLKTSHPTLDAYNKFGVNLYLAGACAALSDKRSLSREEQAALVREAVEVVGSKPDQARHLIQRLDTYNTEPRYQAMITAGRQAMNRHLTGDADPFHALGGVMKDWNTPQTRQLANSAVTILFTDMIGSTDMTHQVGDAAAQDVIRAHNSIVRNALSNHRGKEVKHTGDGIMASFDDAVDAVRAAIQIQRAVRVHNEKWTKLPLHLRVGMNTGEPIIEENDYFGATVQIAARVCAAAGMDQIWIGPATHEQVTRASDISLFSHGAQRLKGVREEQYLFEVVWNGERAAELDAIRRFREADKAAATSAGTEPESIPAKDKTMPAKAVPLRKKLPPLPPPTHRAPPPRPQAPPRAGRPTRKAP